MAKKTKEKKLNLDSILFKCRDILRKASNAGSFFEKRRLRSLCNQGLIHLIGSDAHDVKERSYQELITASRKLPNSLLTYFEANANDILK